MMEIAFASVPMLGHLMPLLPYAEVLLKRGHHVTIFHEEDPKYRNLIEGCGLSACKSVTYEGNESPVSGSLHDRIRDYYSDRNKPSVMVFEFFASDAADAADALGVPSVSVFPNPVSINPWSASASEQDTYKWALWNRLVCWPMEQVLARGLWLARSKTRWKRNLPLLTEQDTYPTSRYTMPRPVIGCAAPELEFNAPAFQSGDKHQLDHTNRFSMVGPATPSITEPLSDDLENWIQDQEDHDRPLVYVAFGTMAKHTPQTVKILQAQLAQHDDVAVLWSLKEEAQLALDHPLPKHWRIQSHFPQVSLFRTGKIGAFVTHCGSNSVGEALLSGVPMVCCPNMADQPANASRLARAGVGIIAKGGATGVGAALGVLLTNIDTIKAKSMALAKALPLNGGAEKAADLIEEYAKAGPLIYSCGRDAYKHRSGNKNASRQRTPWWPIPFLCGATIPLAGFVRGTGK